MMTMPDALRAKMRMMFSPAQAPAVSGPEASDQQKEASGISQGVRSDKKPLVRKTPRGPIWMVPGPDAK